MVDSGALTGMGPRAQNPASDRLREGSRASQVRRERRHQGGARVSSTKPATVEGSIGLVSFVAWRTGFTRAAPRPIRKTSTHARTSSDVRSGRGNHHAALPVA